MILRMKDVIEIVALLTIIINSNKWEIKGRKWI